MTEQIQHSKPWITKADIEAVSEVISSLFIAQGDRTRALERRLSSWMNASDGVAVASGSAAILLALKALGIEAGDEVILPTYVCRSVLQAVCTAGGVPVLADVGRNWVLTKDEVEKVVSSRTRAIIVPHLYGIFADIGSFRALGIPIIEDCAQALAAPRSRPLESDIAVLSFHPTKCLASGEGGMAVTSDPVLSEHMRSHRDGEKTGCKPRLFSPFSDLAASLLMAQLDRYEAGLERRREIAASYIKAIESHCPCFLNRETLDRSMFFRFPIRVPGGLDAHQQAFADLGIHVRKGVDTLLHREIGLDDGRFPVALDLFHTTVSLPIYPALSAEEEARCVEAITRALPRLA